MNPSCNQVMIILLFFSLLTFGICSIVSAEEWSEPYEGYYLFLGNVVDEEDPCWAEDAQGITRDYENWYITQSFDLVGDDPEGRLWKIPIEYDLGEVSGSESGVIMKSASSIQSLVGDIYWHFGTVVYHPYEGTGYLLIPLTDGNAGGGPPILTIFYAENLSFIGYSVIPLMSDAGWCAIDPEGDIYFSDRDHASYYKKYHLEWPLIPKGNVKLTPLENIPFYDALGNPMSIYIIQSGVMSQSGHQLYISSGYYSPQTESDGIHVFDSQTHRLIARSSNGVDPFDFQIANKFPNYEEPEGMAIFSDNLYVLLLDNDLVADDVYLKHYTNTILIDASYGNVGNGKPNSPFTSIQEAQKWINCIHWRNCPRYCPWNFNNIPHEDNLPQGIWCRFNNTDPDDPNTFIIECFDRQGNPWYPDLAACGLCNHPWDVPNPAECIGWDGARIKIRAGTYPESYPEPLIFDKQIQLFADGGTARIRSRVALSPSGTINIGKSGVLKIY